MNEQLQYALVTPSFRTDLARCELLVESVDRHVAAHVKHYLVIDRRDVPMFRSLASGTRTEILVVEDIVPPWIVRVPGIRRFWLSLRSRPLKNWILQQIVKMSVPSTVQDDVLLYTDSDTFFIDRYEPRDFEREGRVPLLAESGQRGLIPSNDQWQGISSRLLGLPVEKECDINYIGNVVCWRREIAVQMCQRITEVTGKRWELALAAQHKFSEYITYGLYVKRFLGTEAAGHWDDDAIRTLTHWETNPLSVPELEALKAKHQRHQYSCMISAKSHTDVAGIRKVFF